MPTAHQVLTALAVLAIAFPVYLVFGKAFRALGRMEDPLEGID
jgi:hypothetical protein